MITVLSSPKPGSGTSTTAALLALAAAAAERPTALVDLAGDQPSLLSVTPTGWVTVVSDHLRLVPAETHRLAEQAALLTASRPDEFVVVDAGRDDHPIHDHLPPGATVTWVLRPC